MTFLSHDSLAYFLGKPVVTADLRSKYQDFKVFEILPFSPTNEGEHLFIEIEKTGTNTVYVARQLAKYFGVKENLVTYAGLKDRFAVTKQWFGVHLPGKKEYDLSDCLIDGVTILQSVRHNKKLKTGALLGNKFEITLRNVTDKEELLNRYDQVIKKGIPNYFGEQRFGIEQGNLDKALALFDGQKVKDKKKRGMYLSAARSYLFNYSVHQRIENQHFDVPMGGDVFMLAGTQSIFSPDLIDEDIFKRLKEQDIDITATMWGAGELKTTASTHEFESKLSQLFPEFCQGLAKFGLKQERRRIRLSITQAKTTINDDNSVTLSFILPAGCYATTVLREVVNYQDVSERHVSADRLNRNNQ